MRLLEVTASGRCSLSRDTDNSKAPPYAILSHTWMHGQEVEYSDITGSSRRSLSRSAQRQSQCRDPSKAAGWRKVDFCLAQIRRDGLRHCWIDSCCIDKASPNEKHGAFAAMFLWYQRAHVCYVYLHDVRAADDLVGSHWWTRGWTLQELLAPSRVVFFAGDGTRLGDKESLQHMIYAITRINRDALMGTVPLSQFTIEEKLSWMRGRQTTFEEDWAYCLQGILGFEMSRRYGEGRRRAIERLKGEAARRQIEKETEEKTYWDSPSKKGIPTRKRRLRPPEQKPIEESIVPLVPKTGAELPVQLDWEEAARVEAELKAEKMREALEREAQETTKTAPVASDPSEAMRRLIEEERRRRIASEREAKRRARESREAHQGPGSGPAYHDDNTAGYVGTGPIGIPPPPDTWSDPADLNDGPAFDEDGLHISPVGGEDILLDFDDSFLDEQHPNPDSCEGMLPPLPDPVEPGQVTDPRGSGTKPATETSSFVIDPNLIEVTLEDLLAVNPPLSEPGPARTRRLSPA
ncbi:HET domain-containing protein [Microdochium nivale]|nr:HET domain-containing protein [Microdochium nivale]